MLESSLRQSGQSMQVDTTLKGQIRQELLANLSTDSTPDQEVSREACMTGQAHTGEQAQLQTARTPGQDLICPKGRFWLFKYLPG